MDDIVGTRNYTTHKPTARQRVLVRQMVRVGIPLPYIAKELGIGVETLKRHYDEIITKAEVQAITKVLNVVYRRALAGDEKYVDRFLGAKMKRQSWLREDWDRNVQRAEAQPITLEIDVVGAISTMLNNAKRGEEPVLIEQKDRS